MIDKINKNPIIQTIKPVIKKEKEHAYVVGGFIRDCLSGMPSCDVDIVVEYNHAEAFARKLADAVDGFFVELDNVNCIYRVVFSDKQSYVDIADCIEEGIEEDLKRRDFTINAMAYDLYNDELIDITDAQCDLKNGIIREISAKNITDDPIRIFRAFRFQSQFGFCFSPELSSIIREHAFLIEKTAKERVNAELIKLFEAKYTVEALHSLDEYKILELIFPEVKEMKKVPKNSHHHLDLLEHSIETVKQVQNFYDSSGEEVKKHLDEKFSGMQKRIAYLKLGAFLHDVAKPSTWQIEPETGRHRFIMHDSEGAKLIVPSLKALKFSKKQIAYLQKIIKNHIYPAGVVTSQEVSQKAYLRFYRKMENETIDLIAVAYADRLSALGPEITQEMIDCNLKGLKALLEGYLEERNKLAPIIKLLDGKEIMQILNIPPSPFLGEIIDKLKEAQISSEVNTREEAIEFVKKCNTK